MKHLPVDIAFYLLKIEAFQIDKSNPAPLISIIARPTIEAKQTGYQREELAERHVTTPKILGATYLTGQIRKHLSMKIEPQVKRIG